VLLAGTWWSEVVQVELTYTGTKVEKEKDEVRRLKKLELHK